MDSPYNNQSDFVPTHTRILLNEVKYNNDDMIQIALEQVKIYYAFIKVKIAFIDHKKNNYKHAYDKLHKWTENQVDVGMNVCECI